MKDSGSMRRTSKSDLQPKQEVRALVVDDQSIARLILRSCLKNVGVCDTVMKEDAKEAFDGLEDSAVDVIFTDIQMPGWDGRRFVSEVRAHRSWCQLPVVAVISLKEDELNWRELGFSAYMHKPYTIADLKVVLNKVLPAYAAAAC